MFKFLRLPAIALSFFAGSGALASETGSQQEEVAVRAVLDNIFDAMRAGDGKALASYLLADAPLDRITPDKPIDHGTASEWIEAVDKLKPGYADEKIFDVKIQIEGPLATAWAPFTIHIDGALKSCGVNHFTLVKLEGDWKVAYLIDTHTPDKCIPE